jgi:SecY interacting protein Syd
MSETATSQAEAALERFVARYLERYPTLHDPFDPGWRSPCEIGAPVARDGAEFVSWRPTRRDRADDFRGLERALELEVHPDIKAYYGAYWSSGLEATAVEGHVSLILLWNREDADRLVENLIGHALAKRRAKSPFTVFFACTEPESDLFLSVDNASGAVVLERPGSKPMREVAKNLAEFLDRLTPAAPELHPERRGTLHA